MNRKLLTFLAGGLLVALLLAGVASSFASGSPDGLDHAARQGCTFGADDEITGGTCMAQQEREHQLAGSPLADYGIRGIDNEFLSTGLSGVFGVLLTFAIGGGLFWALRRRTPAVGDSAPTDGTAPGDPRTPGADGTAGEHEAPRGRTV